MIENERESRKTVLLLAAHGGRAVTYLFHTDVVRALLNSNIRVVGLVDDVLVDRLTEEFKGLDVVFERGDFEPRDVRPWASAGSLGRKLRH